MLWSMCCYIGVVSSVLICIVKRGGRILNMVYRCLTILSQLKRNNNYFRALKGRNTTTSYIPFYANITPNRATRQQKKYILKWPLLLKFSFALRAPEVLHS